MGERRSTVLVVEDHLSTRRFLADNLAADGYEIVEAESVVQARDLLCTAVADLAVVDLGLPDGDGLDLITEVRDADRAGRVDPGLPLLILTGRDDELHRLRGFSRGGDDYLVKPFSYPELRARVQALLRRARAAGSGASRLRVGPLEIDCLARQAWLEREPLQLSKKEFGLLRALAADPTRVFTREELLRDVWGFRAMGATRTLDSHAARLRKKLAAHGVSFVINVWGVGYRLMDGTPR